MRRYGFASIYSIASCLEAKSYAVHQVVIKVIREDLGTAEVHCMKYEHALAAREL